MEPDSARPIRQVLEAERLESKEAGQGDARVEVGPGDSDARGGRRQLPLRTAEASSTPAIDTMCVRPVFSPAAFRLAMATLREARACSSRTS